MNRTRSLFGGARAVLVAQLCACALAWWCVVACAERKAFALSDVVRSRVAAYDEAARASDTPLDTPLDTQMEEERAQELQRLALGLSVLGAERSVLAVQVDNLAAHDVPAAAGHLVSTVERAPQAWLRARAALALAETTQDQVATRLLLRLRDERDDDARVSVAFALARFGNFAGVAALREELAAPRTDYARATAASIVSVAAGADVHAVATDWSGSTHARLPRKPWSARARAEWWRRIAALASDDDDERRDAAYVLARGDAQVAECLGEALHDVDARIRDGAARALAELGPRAEPAVLELIAALAEPTVAPSAALALGASLDPRAVKALESARDDAEPVLRAAIESALRTADGR